MMNKQVTKIIINIACLYLVSNFSSEIVANGFLPIVLFGVVLWLLNLILRPLLLLIALPLNIVTLGIFSVLINTWMIMLANAMIKGVIIPGFLLALILASMIMVLNSFAKKHTPLPKRNYGLGQ